MKNLIVLFSLTFTWWDEYQVNLQKLVYEIDVYRFYSHFFWWISLLINYFYYFQNFNQKIVVKFEIYLHISHFRCLKMMILVSFRKRSVLIGQRHNWTSQSQSHPSICSSHIFFIKILNYQTKSKFLTTFLNLKAKVIEISCISSNFLLKKFHFCLECLGSSHPSQPDTAASLTHRRALAFCKIFSQLDQHMNKTTQSRFCGGLSSKNWCPALLFSVRRVYSKNWAPAKSTK